MDIKLQVAGDSANVDWEKSTVASLEGGVICKSFV